jgi:molybdopterin/thiamine biosynthesis adenylyltransferase/molybdopterin synthase catalytic subunit/rhodanese-related sulfurtransferase
VRAFEFSDVPLGAGPLTASLADPAAGGLASFEGWVRDHNDGRAVRSLEYEAYAELAVKEGERIVVEAIARFGVRRARCVHRVGALPLGEMAVWVGVSAPHRAEAFAACRYIIDEVKHRVPIWKKEHYVSGDSGWVNCERCAADGAALAGAYPHDVHAHAVHAHDVHAHAPARALGRHDHEPGGAADAPARHPRGLPAADYSRQTVLPEVGRDGQARLRAARVLVIGAGGLGVPVLGYLTGAGIGTLGVVDGDLLEASNLHRQTLYALADVGRPKALLAAQRLQALNPEVDVRAYPERADAARLPALAAGYDVLVDCSDNFATRFLVNDVAVQFGLPAVLASVYQYEGQLQVVRAGGACLRCVWPQATRDGLVGNCAEAGVLGPVPGTLGSLQALEVLKLILGLPTQLTDAVLLVDLGTLETRRLKAGRATACRGGPCVRITAAGDAGAAAAARPADSDLEIPVHSLAGAAAAGYVIVDLRDADEVAARPAPAPHLRIPLARLLDHPDSLTAEGRYLLLCARGQRSRVAAEALRRAGFARVWSVAGGIAALPGA